MAGAERQQCIDGIRVRPSHGRIWAYLVINFREGYSVRDMDGGPLNQPQWRDLQYRALQSRPDRGHLYENGVWAIFSPRSARPPIQGWHFDVARPVR
jgi:hypothetical protein